MKIGIRAKAFILSCVIMGVIIIVGGVGLYTAKDLRGSISTLSNQSLPAVRNMTLVDMMHDGVRAVVYRSLVATPEEKGEVEAEFKEFTENMDLYLTNISTLKLSAELNGNIEKARPVIEGFKSSGKKVIEAALTGDKTLANQELPTFLKSFEFLEEELGKIGEAIEAEAATQSSKSQENADLWMNISIGAVAFGLLISCLVSYAAYAFVTKLTNGLTQITTNLKTEAATLVETSHTMSGVSGKLSEATTEQAATLQETVSSLNEISAMVSRNAESSTTSAKMSEQSTQFAQRGKEKTEQMMVSINAISSGNDEIIKQMQKSNQEISEIVKVIEEIGQKTQVINDIVFQTKLLSFNASVEAARAGEHGKGFAVVAEEVGNLASMSGKAATEITDMLTRSVQRVTGIVDGTKDLMENLIKQSKEKVEFGTSTARQCTQALDDILANVSSVNEMVREISNASQEQSAGVKEINKAMNELDSVTQSNSGIAQESSEAATALQSQASRLDSLIRELTLIVTGQSEEARPVSKTHVGSQTIKKASPKVKVVQAVNKAPPSKSVELTVPDSSDSRFDQI